MNDEQLKLPSSLESRERESETKSECPPLAAKKVIQDRENSFAAVSPSDALLLLSLSRLKSCLLLRNSVILQAELSTGRRESHSGRSLAKLLASEQATDKGKARGRGGRRRGLWRSGSLETRRKLLDYYG